MLAPFKVVLAVVASGGLLASAVGTQYFTPTTAHAQSGARVDIGIFFGELAPHGRWLQTRHGYVWSPKDVSDDWRPYSRGRWAYTAVNGWCWVSSEPFGWATYHYGRWGYDPDYGWFWTPGSEWAPAWVSWQYSDEHVGWAPLPPTRPGYVFASTFSVGDIGVGGWNFVPTRSFLEADLRTIIVAAAQNSQLLSRTRPIGTVRVVNNVVINNVITVSSIEKVVNRKVVVHQITSANRPQNALAQGNVVQVYRPAIARTEPKTAPKQAAVVSGEVNNKPAALTAEAKAAGTGKAASLPENPQGTPGAEPKSGDVKGTLGAPKDAEPKAGKAQPSAADPKSSQPTDAKDTTKQPPRTEPKAERLKGKAAQPKDGATSGTSVTPKDRQPNAESDDLKSKGRAKSPDRSTSRPEEKGAEKRGGQQKSKSVEPNNPEENRKATAPKANRDEPKAGVVKGKAATNPKAVEPTDSEPKKAN